MNKLKSKIGRVHTEIIFLFRFCSEQYQTLKIYKFSMVEIF